MKVYRIWIGLIMCMTIMVGVVFAESVPINDIVGAGGVVEKYNNVQFESKSVYFTDCKRMGKMYGEEIYMIETNVGNLGDNILLVYPNKQGLISKILLLARRDSRLGKEMNKKVMEEVLTLFTAIVTTSRNDEEMENMISAYIQAGETGRSSFWSITQGRRYIIERFYTTNNNVPFINVRITAQI